MRFFLDNCLAIRHARALNEMVKPDHCFIHLQEKFSPDAKDDEWIRKLGEEGGWIVISGEYRIGKSAHEREGAIPQIAQQAKRASLMLTRRGWSRILSGMKLTFTLPDRLARRFQSAYPQEKQSQVVAGLLARKLRIKHDQMARACRVANGLKQVEKDMEDWEKLNLSEP